MKPTRCGSVFCFPGASVLRKLSESGGGRKDLEMAGVGEASQSENTSGVVGCRHYWVIDVADSRRSRGKCAHCGATKDFPNYFGDCVIDPDLFDRWVGRWDEVQGSAERLGGISGY